MAQSGGGTPEWQGWLVLGTLIVGFAALGWWLFFSPLPEGARPVGGGRQSLRARQLLAGLVLLSGTLFVVGTRWDELWHRLYGGFGDDFLWPPHLMMYASLGLNLVFAVFGLAIAGLRGPSGSGLRERFRSEPLLGLLGLLAAYQMASIPSDLLWHQIIGPDLTAWSLPHVLLIVTTTGTWLTGLAISLSTLPPRARWEPVWHRLSVYEAAALVLTTLATLMLLQIGTTEWEWLPPGGFVSILRERPAWAYPVVVVAIGAVTSALALHATRRVGSATVVALGALLAQVVYVAIARSTLPPGPTIAAHLVLLPPAVAVDWWYASTARRAYAWRGSLLYGLVYLAVALPYDAAVLPVLELDLPLVIQIVGIGLAVAASASLVGQDLGAWLRVLERPAGPPQSPSDLRRQVRVGVPGASP